ncbi:MAG: phage/plasmid primase, P4 family [Nibricoccus sp.]
MSLDLIPDVFADGVASAVIEARGYATDTDASIRFATRHHDHLRFVPGLGWHVWNGKHWELDQRHQILELAKESARAWTVDCAKHIVDGREKAVREALVLEQAGHIRAMIDLAKSDRRLVLPAAELDSDPWLLNVSNGTLDLKSGKLRQHSRKDLHSRMAPVNYVDGAKHEVLTRFMEAIDASSPGMAAFLARCFGACLTGDCSPETLFLLQGPGGCGKTTITEAMGSMLGDYSVKLPFESFCLCKHGRSPGAASPDIVRLRGSRLAYASEGDAAARIDAGMVKTLTGGEPITARGLYSDPITFRQTWKLWMVSNYEPRADSDDSGLWRRMLKVYFSEVPVSKRDPNIKQILTEDPAARSALLFWAVQGCLAWQGAGRGRHGLQAPEAVLEATATYRSRQDSLAEWWDAVLCEAELDTGSNVSATEVRKKYDRWCAQNGCRPVSSQRLAKFLESKGLVPKRTMSNRYWSGIRF